MNLRQLEVLRAVVLSRTTVAAAQRIGLSQPAVSNAIRSIESRLGFALFTRLNNRMIPTAECRLIIREAETIFAIHGKLEAKIRDMRETKTQHLHIVATPPLSDIIPTALKTFLTKRPNLHVYFDVHRLDRVVEDIESNVADLGFLLGANVYSTVHSEALFSDRMMCMFAPGHVFETKKVISPADLEKERLILLDAIGPLGMAIRQSFEYAEQPLRAAIEVHHTHQACALAERDLGVAIVDPFTASNNRYNLRARPFEPCRPAVAYAFWSKGRPMSRSAKAFILDVKSAMQKMGTVGQQGQNA
jgi:DNA-binding transcriptional LysR family regulator